MKNIINILKSYINFDKTAWIIFAIALVLNLILWYLWFFKIQFNKITMFYCFAIFIINTILAFWISIKDIAIAYFLLGAAALVQVFVLVLIYNTI